MHRFFVTDDPAGVPELAAGDAVDLLETDAQHVARVLRLRAGERIVLCDGRGSDYEAVLVAVHPSRTVAHVVQRRPSRGEPPLTVTLLQGVPKGEKMDLIVQKAVEVGVGRIVPVFTSRTVVEWDAAKAQARRRRWQRIAYEAAKQCGRGRVPVVECPVSWEELWRTEHESLGRVLLPWEEETSVGLRAVARALSPGPVAIAIGPEGGFDPAEVEMARARGAQPVTLGPRVLRTETAGLVAASILLYEWGDLGGPEAPSSGPPRPQVSGSC